MDNNNWIKYWRISSTSAGLAHGHFFARGLPPPNTPTFTPYTQKVPQSQGGISRQGYNNISILWDFMDAVQLKTLNGIVEAAITAGTIYATVDRADGTKLANDFIDVSGQAQPLEFTTISNARGVSFSNILLVLTNLVIDSDPSTVL